MNTPHTPGPWKFDGTGPANACVVSNAGDLLAIGAQGTTNIDEDNANLRLMASAPELLASCHQLVATCDVLASNGVMLPLSIVDCYATARAAIAKATSNT